MQIIVLAGLALCALNIWTFAAFGYDKRQSRRKGWRVSEGSLLTWAALGGSPGALAGRHLFRHKTRKQPFVRHLWTIVVVHVLMLAGWLGWTVGTP